MGEIAQAMPISRPAVSRHLRVLKGDGACVGAAAPGLRKGDNRYLAGNELSLADLMLAPHYSYFSLTPEGRDLLGPQERLRRWWQEMESRESIRKTQPNLT